jgi:predicted RNase H-like nuclease
VRLYGVDGCRGGWVAASLDAAASPGAPRFALYRSLDELFAEAAAGRATIAIDIPIGLGAGARASDREARRLLGRGRASSVVPAPSRTLVEAWPDICAVSAAERYRRACEVSRRACGKRISQQLFNIVHKIAEVDALMTPALQVRVREAHPEVSFCVLNDGTPMRDRKGTAAGRLERLGVLRARGLHSDAVAWRRELGGGDVVWLDDIIDAAICLVTARRTWLGRESALPEHVERDARGLRMEIVA